MTTQWLKHYWVAYADVYERYELLRRDKVVEHDEHKINQLYLLPHLLINKK